MALERLQKIMAAAGVASRRGAEEMIAAGRVTLNGKVVAEQGTKADALADVICVDGAPLKRAERLLYFLLNKPKGYVTTVSDPEGRKTVMELLHDCPARVYPVGRLDYHSEGLLLLTNDGEFAKHITSAANHVTKTYVAKVNGQLTPAQEENFRQGVSLSGKRTAPAGLKLIQRAENPWYEVRLIEGRQNQIRLMFKNFGRLVEKLRRVRIGFLELGSLKPGEVRHLKPAEVARFRKLLKMEEQ